MEYEVSKDFYNAEFDIRAEVGERLQDGDVEPDLIAQWLSDGRIKPVGLTKAVKPSRAAITKANNTWD